MTISITLTTVRDAGGCNACRKGEMYNPHEKVWEVDLYAEGNGITFRLCREHISELRGARAQEPRRSERA